MGTSSTVTPFLGSQGTCLTSASVVQYAAPEGVVNIGGEWFYDEYARGAGVSSVGMEDSPRARGATPGDAQALPPADEKRKILDLFRN